VRKKEAYSMMKSIVLATMCLVAIVVIIMVRTTTTEMYTYDPNAIAPGYSELLFKGRPYFVDERNQQYYVGRKKVDWTKFGCTTNGWGPIHGVDTRYGKCQSTRGSYDLCLCEEGTYYKNVRDPMGSRYAICKNQGRCKYHGDQAKITAANTRAAKLLRPEYIDT
jgi:hypothetical protein